MRPTKTIDRPRHLSDEPLSTVPVIARHLVIDLEPRDEQPQAQAGTNPKTTDELAWKGRPWSGR